jgi:tetratricopeptide (TPR) repeat protein
MSGKVNSVELGGMLEAALQRAECGSPPIPEIAQQWLQEVKGDARLQGVALDILAHAHQHLSDHRLAQAAFREAAQCYAQAGLLSSSTSSLILLGTSHLLNGEPLLALDQWSKALLLARDLQNLALCAKVYLGVGQVYIGFGDDETSLRYNEMALKMAKVLGDSRLECEVYLYVASDNYRLQRYTSALLAIDNAEQRLDPQENKVWAAEIVYYRGAIHAGQGLYAQARLELETAYELSNANKNLWGRLHALAALGEVLLQLQDPAAEATLLQALEMAQHIQLERIQTRCCTALINYYLQQEQFDAALPLYASLFAQRSERKASVSPRHQQRIAQLETRSQILQLQRSVAIVDK